jgi:preprotein translocase subunit SecE
VSKLKQAVTGVQTFLGEVQVELKKCTWPTRPELLESTVVVIVAILILGAAVGFSDLVLNMILRLVIR